MSDAIQFIRCDGGRSLAGFKGKTGDCCARAFAIASGRPYREVYDLINQLARTERPCKRYRGQKSSAREGVFKALGRRLAEEMGATWTPVMKIGSGCTMHVRENELPPGRHVLLLSHHYAAVIDRVLFDSHDSSRNGTRCVYGYFTFPD